MRRISGTTLGAVGLLLGMTVGFALLVFKQWLIGEIVDALDDEVKAACDCTLAFDSFDLSFSQLGGRATNVRLLEKGKTALSFKEITAKVSLEGIFDKQVFIEDLHLSEGNADGVGPDSATFRFIDQLTTAPPPEKAKPGRWRSILNHLTIGPSKIREPFPSDHLPTSELLGEDVTLDVLRDGEDFHLTPVIGKLRYRSLPGSGNSTDLDLGRLAAKLLITDDRTFFQTLKLGRDNSSIDLKAEVEPHNGDRLTGQGNFSIDSNYIGLPDWLSGQLLGAPSLGATLGSPVLSGPLRTEAAAPLNLTFKNATPISLPKVEGDLTVDVNHGDPVVTIREMYGEGNGLTMTGTRPLTFTDKGLDAGFSIHADRFGYGPFVINDAEAAISVFKEGTGTATSFRIDAANLMTESTSLGPMEIDITLHADRVSLTLRSTNPLQGSLQASGEILLPETGEPTLENGHLTLTDYRYPLTLPVDPKDLAPMALSADLLVHGPLDLARLSAEGSTTVSFPALPEGFSFRGTSELRRGTLAVRLPESTRGAAADLKIDVGSTMKGALNITLPRVPISTFLAGSECGTAAGNLSYSFSMAKPLGGSGSLKLNELQWGCSPYTLTFPKDSNLPIKDGSLELSSLKLQGSASTLTLNGSIGFEKGFNVRAAGGLLLSSLLPFAGGVDDLRGNLTVKVTIAGPLGLPLLSGTADLQNGEVGIATPDISAHDVHGSMRLDGHSIKVESLQGKINGGTFVTNGTIEPLAMTQSQLETHLSNVTVEPMDDASLTLSGDLRLATGEHGRPELGGAITIDAAEVSKDLDPKRLLVQTIAGYILPTSTPITGSPSEPIDLELNLSVSAPRNIFVLTPLVSVELNAQLGIRGTVSDPAIRGTMQVLSGWVAIKDNYFDITSGTATFRPGSIEPTIDISSEGTLRSSSGENILVVLEASGPLRSPRIELSSDRGLSKDELLLLLTSSRSLTGRTMTNTVGRQFGYDQRFLLSTDTFSSLGSFIRGLARIDALSFEPLYNPYTGTLEPGIVGRKNIAERLALVGESTFGTVSNSRAGLVYNLTPSLNASGFIQSVSTQKNSALSADLTYTVLSDQAKFLKVEVSGLTTIDKFSLLSAARLGPSSRVRNKPEGLQSVQRSLQEYMVSEGYLTSSIQVTCNETEGEYCHLLQVTVNEGPLYTVSGLVTRGDEVPDTLRKIAEKEIHIGKPALAASLRSAEERLIIALRNEGFIAARVTSEYELADENAVQAVLTVDLRTPISFVFRGNTVFTPAEFLDSIQIFSRKRPFGNNTIQLLTENIERMYQEKGYLFVQVSSTEDRSQPPRLTYVVDIQEEVQATVRKLTLNGNNSLSRKRIREVMRELGFGEQVAFLKPEYAVPAELDSLRDILTSVFHQEGFPQVAISYNIVPVGDGRLIDIVFTIQEGERLQILSISVNGLPRDIEALPKPPQPASVPRVNKYVTQLLERLRDEGYLFPSLSTDIDPETDKITVDLDPGERTFIESVDFEGLAIVSPETVERFTTIKQGDPYRVDEVNATKRLLLRSGLFSRVDIVPKDDALDSPRERIVVRLSERPLQTLEVGGGLNSEFGVHVFGEAVDKSLFADGKSIALRLDTYLDSFDTKVDSSGSSNFSQGFASARYNDPSLLDSDLSLTEELRYQRQNLSTFEYNLERISGTSLLFGTSDAGFNISGAHSLFFDDVENVPADAIISPLDSGAVRLSLLTASVNLDRRDDPLLPHSGYTFTIDPKVSAKMIGSEADFASINSKATAIVPLEPLSPRFSLGLGIFGGISQAFGNTDEIPITQRFYLGGRTTVRGFRENSLGPRGAQGSVIGGDAMFGGSSQLQYLINPSISTHIFTDAGSVMLRHESGTDLRFSTGFGFRYLSPIGPIGLDIGHPLNERSGEPSIRLHFSVGSKF